MDAGAELKEEEEGTCTLNVDVRQTSLTSTILHLVVFLLCKRQREEADGHSGASCCRTTIN